MAYPTKLLTEGETVVREFRPHWKVLILPVLSTIAMIVVVILLTSWDWLDARPTIRLIVLGIVVLVWLVYAGSRVLNWRFTQYVLTTERLIVRTGIISKHGKEIPLENINDVGFSQGPIERTLRYGDVLIESAGEHGQSVLADIPDPEQFHTEVYAVREQLRLTHDSAASRDPAARLETLARLHREGTLTSAEFEEQKRKLLAEM